MTKLLICEYNSDLVYAIIENDELREAARYRENPLFGRVYRGVIKDVTKNGFIFADIGLEKNAFMNAPKDYKFKTGELITAQIQSAPNGDKGAKISLNIRIKNKYALVSRSKTPKAGLSKKIDKGRLRLLNLAHKESKNNGIYDILLRTACLEILDETIKSEIDSLKIKLTEIEAAAQNSKAPSLVYEADSWPMEFLRYKPDETLAEPNLNLPNDLPNLKRQTKIWEELNLKIHKLFNRKTWLPCGGFLIIDYAEACVVIDVNTGKNINKDREACAHKTNCEAAKIIPRLITALNLSGSIVIDFIYTSEAALKETAELLQETSKAERISPVFKGMLQLGMTQLTRRKNGENLRSQFLSVCKNCNGNGAFWSENDS